MEPSPQVFSALLAGDVNQLCACSSEELRPFLPCLARMVLSPSFNSPSPSPATAGGGGKWADKRKVVHSLIAGFRVTGSIKAYISVDLHQLQQDALKEQQLLRKLVPGEERPAGQSVLATSLQYGLAIEFERSDCVRRFRLFLSEVLRIMSQVDTPFHMEQSDLFEQGVHLEEVTDIMCIAAAELPNLLPIVHLTEALLRLDKGPQLLSKLIANMPSAFDQVVTSLVLNGESQDEVSLAGRCRMAAICSLCTLYPSRAAYVQSLAVQNCKHPTLALTLALEADEQLLTHSGQHTTDEGAYGTGVVPLLHSIIITGDEHTRAWFSQYMKLMQQKFRRQKSSAVTKLRRFIMRKLFTFTKTKLQQKPARNWPASMDIGQDGGVGSGQDGTMEIGNEADDEPMEAELVIDTGVSKSSVDNGDREEGGEEGGRGVEEEFESTLALVDQMEIEISDREGGELGEEEKATPGQETAMSSRTDAPPSSPPTSLPPPTHPRSPSVQRRRRHSSVLEQIEFPLISMEQQLSDTDIIELTSLLHVCCALKVQAQMYLTNEETASILRLIACSCPPFSPAGVTFIEITLAMLLACPFLISLEECEHAVVLWFQWLLEKLPDFDRSCGGQCSYGEMLLLIAIHLREKQLTQIDELVSNTLKMKFSSSQKSPFRVLRKLYLDVFTERVVCAHAVSVPPTVTLNAQMSGYLPVHCIHQLIKTKTFRKYGISIKEWIYQQILTVAEPLHPTLPPLIQEFVFSLLIPSAPPPPSSNSSTPFSAEEVLQVFRVETEGSDQTYPIPAQLLMLYYVLLYQDCRLANLKTLLMQPGGSHGEYSSSVLAQIPMRHLLCHARQRQTSYATLYPSLLKLTATHFPQLCIAENWLIEEEDNNTLSMLLPRMRLNSKTVNLSSTKRILQDLHSSPSRALLLLSYLSTLPPTALIPYSCCLTSTLPLLLLPCTSRKIQALYLMLWTRLNTVIPRKLWLETVNALRSHETSSMRPLTHQALTKDPLTVLRCDSRVFRCPPVFSILLKVLAAYTLTSKAWLQEQAHTQTCVIMANEANSSSASTQAAKQEREELCIALTAAQESAVVQLLLEICLPTDEDKKDQGSLGFQLSALKEIQCLVCSYLHQAFITEPNMVKLVHFQGYPSELLPMVVSGVPSVHISLDFIPELLSQPHLERQQFTVQLAAEVIHQYPLPEAMGIAKDIFKRLIILTNEIPEDMKENYFLPILPATVKLCQTFPPLCCDATEFLVQLSKSCSSLKTKNEQGLFNSATMDVVNTKSYDSGSSCLTTSIYNAFQELVNMSVVKA